MSRGHRPRRRTAPKVGCAAFVLSASWLLVHGARVPPAADGSKQDRTLSIASANVPSPLRPSDGMPTDRTAMTRASLEVPLQMVSLSANPTAFSPNGDGGQDTTTIRATFNHPTHWTLSVGGVVQSGIGQSLSYTWDGTVNGRRLPDGFYTINVRGTDSTGRTVQKEDQVRIDTTAPRLGSLTASLDPLFPGQTAAIAFTLLAEELGYVKVRIFNRGGTQIQSVRAISTAGPHTVVWDGKTKKSIYASPGLYTYSVWDQAGNKSAASGTISFNLQPAQ